MRLSLGLGLPRKLFGAFAVFFLFAAAPQVGIAQQANAPLLTQLAQQTNAGDHVFFNRSKNWSVKCDYQAKLDQRKCELSTPLQTAKDQSNLSFSMIIVMANADTPPVAIIRTPLDLHLAKGVDMLIDDKLVGKLTFRSCHQNGCVVPFSMQGTINTRMRAGLDATLEFYDLAGTKHVAKFSLLGITQALRTARDFF